MKNKDNYYLYNEPNEKPNNVYVDTLEKNIEIDNENIEESIIKYADPNIVETISISDINSEFTKSEEIINHSQNDNENIEEIHEDNNSTTNIQNVKVNTKALNIRKEPNKNADIVTIVYQDDLLILCESTSINGFYKITTYTGFEGYCMEQFVDLV